MYGPDRLPSAGLGRHLHSGNNLMRGGAVEFFVGRGLVKCAAAQGRCTLAPVHSIHQSTIISRIGSSHVPRSNLRKVGFALASTLQLISSAVAEMKRSLKRKPMMSICTAISCCRMVPRCPTVHTSSFVSVMDAPGAAVSASKDWPQTGRMALEKASTYSHLWVPDQGTAKRCALRSRRHVAASDMSQLAREQCCSRG